MDVTASRNAPELADLVAVLHHLEDRFCPSLETIQQGIPELPNEHCRVIMGLCEEILGLTREFSEYAAIAGGFSVEQSLDTTLSAVVAEVDRRFDAQAGARGLIWSSSVVGEDIAVRIDPIRHRQVVAHLVGFAINATQAGQTLRFEVAEDDFGWRSTLTGIGLGIADDSIEKAFAPLYPGTPEPGQATGWCLCRDIVESQGGWIELVNNPSGDRTITLWLPNQSNRL